MRWILRFVLSISVLLGILLLLLNNHLQDLWDQYSVSLYLKHSYQKSFSSDGAWSNHPLFRGEAGDKVIIMAKTEKEDTSWVAAELPEYVSTTMLSLRMC